MTLSTLRGLTWEHRRAVDPLRGTQPVFAAHHPDIRVGWTTQPLSSFEFEPVGALARRFDLLVFDHPHVGAIAAGGCLLPLDDMIVGDPFVGPSLASYRYGGRLWGLPIDAAAQVSVRRPDLMADLGDPPLTWDDAIALGRTARPKGRHLALALKGVHSLMTLYTLCASLGTPCATVRDAPFADRAVATRALLILRELASLCPPEAPGWTSIAVHEAMGARDDLVYCPAVYGFAAYAEADRSKPLRFGPLPSPRPGAPPSGSTLGGAGIGVSAFARSPGPALTYARFLADAATQKAFAAHHGQPAHRDAWGDPDNDARFGGFFSATLATMEHAWIRPRYDGYLGFQAAAGPLIEAWLRDGGTVAGLLGRLERLHTGTEG